MVWLLGVQCEEKVDLVPDPLQDFHGCMGSATEVIQKLSRQLFGAVCHICRLGLKHLTGKLGWVNIHLLKSQLCSLLFLFCMQRGHSMCTFTMSADTYLSRMSQVHRALLQGLCGTQRNTTCSQTAILNENVRHVSVLFSFT